MQKVAEFPDRRGRGIEPLNRAPVRLSEVGCEFAGGGSQAGLIEGWEQPKRSE